jgi:hypothetical protein
VGDFDAERGRYYPDQPSAVHSDDFDVVSLTNPDRNYDTADDDGGCDEYVGLLEHPSVVFPRVHRQEHRRRLDHRLPSQRSAGTSTRLRDSSAKPTASSASSFTTTRRRVRSAAGLRRTLPMSASPTSPRTPPRERRAPHPGAPTSPANAEELPTSLEINIDDMVSVTTGKTSLSAG